MNENEEDLRWQRPRSHSQPNLLYVDPDTRDGEPPRSRASNYEYKLERNFGYEIQEYFMLKKEIKKRKMQLMNGEAVDDNPESRNRELDSKQQELLKKQMVNVKGPLIDEDIDCKICDLGNGCWTHYHFVPKIQTRQYRAPEVILGIDYDASTDLWSYACMVFELITGDFLFNPRPGQGYKKNDDHLALFMEMLGPMPKNMAMQGNMFDHYFQKNPSTGKYIFRRIHDLKQVDLRRLLIYRYQIKPKESEMLADFLLKILKWHPKDRPTAQSMLSHPWLTMEDDYNYKMTEMQFKLFELRDQPKQMDNYDLDYNAVMEERAQLMGQVNNQRTQMDLDEIEHMKQIKQAAAGNTLYRYPGQLLDSDEEVNAGDVEDNPPEAGSPGDGSDSEVSWSNNSLNSDLSFSSDKLINGYKDFLVMQQREQLKQAEEQAAQEAGGLELAKWQKEQAKKKQRKR